MVAAPVTWQMMRMICYWIKDQVYFLDQRFKFKLLVLFLAFLPVIMIGQLADMKGS